MTKAAARALDLPETEAVQPDAFGAVVEDIRVAPAAAVALRLTQMLAGGGDELLYVAETERRAEEIGRAVRVFAPEVQPLVLPAWDCLPYDRASPSREVMGRRMAVLARLDAADRAGERPRLLITSPEAFIQRLPPAVALKAGTFALRVGDRLDRRALTAFSLRTGYLATEPVHEPGELSILGAVVDVFPPHLARPVRAKLDSEDRIIELDHFDPLTQRSEGQLESVVLGPASELVTSDDDGDDGGETTAREPGCEHRLPEAYANLRSVFDLPVSARVALEPPVEARAIALIEQVEEAWRTQRDFPGRAERPLPADALYLSAAMLKQRLTQAEPFEIELDGVEPAPLFASLPNPGRAFCDFVAEATDADRRVVLTGLRHELRSLARALDRGLGRPLVTAADWHQATSGDGVVGLEADLGAGFVDARGALTVISASDVLGGPVATRTRGEAALVSEPELQLGDVVIHEDHGVGVLRALERVTVDGVERDTLRLEYQGDATLLAPIEEFGRIWRYGGEPETVTLDRLKGEGWNRRRAEVSRQIDADAQALVAQAREREAARTEPVKAPKAAMQRFAARFAFPETPDQKDAIAAVLEDLASGRPMNRLVCGDVGFGKTEVALRAAAAVALAGRQVAVAAPTTVLARQHALTFERRFAGSGVKVAQLSRLVDSAEAKAVKAGLASGEIGLVVGTHALGGKDVAFHDLGLMILDEEQKFGAKLKAELHHRAPHLLSMTATPIPRTLQAAMVGVQDVSVIASPPARRRPIRTLLAPYDAATVRTALLREKRRGGQSFVVAPRIADLDSLAERLSQIVPELTVKSAHGDLPAEVVDAVMVDFADGQGDVLLATNIIESGLDVPRANTMLVWRPDRFGLAQLHQLRGRVGRGRSQGLAYLFTDPEEEISDTTRARLSTLEAFDRLGSGLAISTRDLDLRGGGDLVGNEQAGHMKLIGASLYHRLMARAVRVARGATLEPEWTAEVSIGQAGVLPQDYIPDPVARINLYARLSRLSTVREIADFEDELADRFGPPPPPAAALLTHARVQVLAKAAGVRRVSAGPTAVAFELDANTSAAARARTGDGDAALTWKGDRLILAEADSPDRVSKLMGVLESLGQT